MGRGGAGKGGRERGRERDEREGDAREREGESRGAGREGVHCTGKVRREKEEETGCEHLTLAQVEVEPLVKDLGFRG